MRKPALWMLLPCVGFALGHVLSRTGPGPVQDARRVRETDTRAHVRALEERIQVLEHDTRPVAPGKDDEESAPPDDSDAPTASDRRDGLSPETESLIERRIQEALADRAVRERQADFESTKAGLLDVTDLLRGMICEELSLPSEREELLSGHLQEALRAAILETIPFYTFDSSDEGDGPASPPSIQEVQAQLDRIREVLHQRLVTCLYDSEFSRYRDLEERLELFNIRESHLGVLRD